MIGGLLAGLGSLGGSIMQNQTNKKLANNAQNFELEMWNKSNEYNSPQAQMARLKSAGLNPNLVYGSGSVSGNSSSSRPNAHVPEYNNPITPMLGAFLDVIRTQAHTANTQASTANKIADTKNKGQLFDIFENKKQAFHQYEFDKGLYDMFLTKQKFEYNRDKLIPFQSALMDPNLTLAKNKSEMSGYDLGLQKALYEFNKNNPMFQAIMKAISLFK